MIQKQPPKSMGERIQVMAALGLYYLALEAFRHAGRLNENASLIGYALVYLGPIAYFLIRMRPDPVKPGSVEDLMSRIRKAYEGRGERTIAYILAAIQREVAQWKT